MRVPEIDNINNELRRDFFEQIVAVMVLINVAFDISGFLEDQVVFTGCRLGPVDLSLVDELAAWGGLRDLNGLGVMDAHVPFRLPLNVIPSARAVRFPSSNRPRASSRAVSARM